MIDEDHHFVDAASGQSSDEGARAAGVPILVRRERRPDYSSYCGAGHVGNAVVIMTRGPAMTFSSQQARQRMYLHLVGCR